MTLPAYHPDPSDTTRFLFFTGKGGVGKTSLSCATALRLAEAGRKVLLVSTDPASNLEEVLGLTIGSEPTPVPDVMGLDAMNIDPVAAAAAYRERMIGPLRGILPESALRKMEEEFSGSCTVEIAAFDEFSALIGDKKAAESYDHIVFDTAPTGHTLRLMSLAKAWDQFLDSNTSGSSCLGPLAGLEKQRTIYEATVKTLADAEATTLVLVSRPQSAALREARRTSGELRELGVANQRLILNGVFTSTHDDDPVAHAMMQRGQTAIADAAEFIASLPASTVPLRAINILGLAGLRFLLDGFDRGAGILPAAISQASEGGGQDARATVAPPMESLSGLISSIESTGRGVIMSMGKGGVGKTTVAAAIAVALARRGHRVHLSTTDPAAHVAETLAGAVDGLSINSIDPAAETAAYREQVINEQGSKLDPAALALLEEDLRSPCTEEIAVFRAFAREVDIGSDRIVVLDTAPTGHTLLLLDASEAYQRELERQARSTQPEAVLKLLERLRDPEFTRILLVTLPEATPVHEAADLQEDLRRARIEPFAWIINQSLLHSGTRDPILRQREAAEIPYLHEVSEHHAKRVVCIPWQAEEPVGPDALARLAGPCPLLPHPIMTYLYETIPAKPGDEIHRYEIKQSIHDESLSHHPETGESIRRVIIGGWGLPSLKSGSSSASLHSGCGCGPRGCC